MKKIGKIIFILTILFIVTACDNSIDRANRTVTLVQDNISGIVNELTEIQINENNLQADFEQTLNHETGFSYFNNSDAIIYNNINNRKEHLKKIEVQREEILKLADEFEKQADSGPLLADQVIKQVDLLRQLNNDLAVYVSDYQSNLEQERIIYQSIANPELNFDSFFKVFERTAILDTNNKMNLEKVLGYFEPINTQLVNFKIYLANLSENN